ncbi:sirohydrochlorin cobaltochelatase [Clostridium sp.]|uniref:sirohydrochlorin cobaltochelatase n=1 Tax=Clostridium sp. TaxID=1506 RepID=UPI002FCA6103
MKRAILFVSFGTGREEDFNKYLLPFKCDAKNKYGDTFDYYFALTSERILSKININIKNYKDTLDELKNSGYEEIYVVPLYFSRGVEYSKVALTTNEYKDKFKVIKCLNPIFEENKNVIDNYFKKSKNILFICHGSRSLNESLDKKYIEDVIINNGKNHYVSSTNEKDKINELIENIKNDGIEDILIVPILLTKGYHFTKDVVLDNNESFFSKIKGEGITCEVVDEALGENEFFRELVIKNIDKLIK